MGVHDQLTQLTDQDQPATPRWEPFTQLWAWSLGMCGTAPRATMRAGGVVRVGVGGWEHEPKPGPTAQQLLTLPVPGFFKQHELLAGARLFQ